MARPVYLSEVLSSPRIVRVDSGPVINQAPPARSRRSELLRGVEWFYYFVPKDNFIGLSEVVPNYLSKFLVCAHIPKVEKTTKMYSAWDSYLEFLNYIRSIPRENWCFFEYIMGQQKQKLYIDVDLSEDYVPIGQHLDVFANNLMEALITRIVDVFQNELDVEFDLTKHLLIFTSHGLNKKSYHIVVDGYCVLNNQENADLLAEILKGIPPEFIEVREGPKKSKKIIDIGMYSSKQQFRLYGSQKPGSGRPKIFLSEFEHQGQYYRHDLGPRDSYNSVERTLLEFSLIFQKSCVTFVDNCHLVTINQLSEEKPLPGGRIRLWSEQGAFDDTRGVNDPEMMKAVLALIPQKINMDIWSISEAGAGIVSLRRRKEGYCDICKRVHENENSYVRVNRYGDVFFYCWREQETGEGRNIRIGNVESNYLKSIVKDHINSIRKQLTRVSPPPGPIVESPFTGSVQKFIQNLATGREPSYF